MRVCKGRGGAKAGVTGARDAGGPLASDGCLRKLERRLGRRLRPLPIGRTKKRKTGPKGNAKKSRKQINR